MFKRTVYLLLFISSVMILAPSCRSHRGLPSTDLDPTTLAIKTKYANLMAVNQSQITNIKLYSFINDWYGTPYKYGGKTKLGIDCSDFVSVLEKEIYSQTVPPPSYSMYDQCKPIPQNDLTEGDLVFFKIDSEKISHVGVYLQNGYFVHASCSKGVMIDKLEENYYKKYFYKGGRLINVQ